MKLIKKTTTSTETTNSQLTNIQNDLEKKENIQEHLGQDLKETKQEFFDNEKNLTPTEKLNVLETDPKLIELDQKLTADEFLMALGANFVTADKIKVPEKDLTEFKPKIEDENVVINKENKIISIDKIDWDLSGKPIYSASLMIDGEEIKQISLFGRFTVGDNVYVINNITKDKVELILNDKKVIVLNLLEKEIAVENNVENKTEVETNINVVESKIENENKIDVEKTLDESVIKNENIAHDDVILEDVDNNVVEQKFQNDEKDNLLNASKTTLIKEEIKEEFDVKIKENIEEKPSNEEIKIQKSFVDFDKEKVEQYIVEIEKYDVDKQVKIFEDLQKRKKSVDAEIMQIEFQKQQIEKDIEKHQKEILELTGLDNVEDFAKYVLDTLRTNEEELSNFKQNIEEQEQKIKEFKLELAKL